MATPEIEAAKRWGATIHTCSVCQAFINDGTEKVWTGAWDAPAGQWRYHCKSCDVSMCQQCFDAKKHDEKHALEFIPPVTSKREAHARNAANYAGVSDDTVDSTNPWNAFKGGLSTQALQRLSQRTGYKF